MSIAVEHDTLIGTETRSELWPHQRTAFDFAAPLRSSLLAIGMGGGKSRIAIELAEHHDAQRILVLCPKSVVGVWPDQLAQHALREWETWSGQVRGARGALKNPSVARRAVALLDASTRAGILHRPLCAVVNYEAAWQGDMGQVLHNTDWDLIVLDESHRIKAPGGKASRYIARLAQRTRRHGGRILALTGTPMPHSPLDLYGQLRALDPDVLGTSYAAFQHHYGKPKLLAFTARGRPIYATTPGGHPIYDGVRPEKLAELTERVSPLLHQVSQAQLDEDLGLPEQIDAYRTTQLDPGSRKVYDALEHDLVAKIGDGVVTAANAMVLVLRLAQATSGYAVDAETGAPRALTDGIPEKARLLSDLLSDLPQAEPVVVFARFHHDLDAIRGVAEAAGRRYGELSGRRRDGLTERSTMNEKTDVLGCQLKSGGVGIDLTRARHATYYSLDFALGDYAQSRKRLHRPGQHRPVLYTHLLAEDTIDTVVLGALRRRQDVVTAVMDRLNQNGATP